MVLNVLFTRLVVPAIVLVLVYPICLWMPNFVSLCGKLQRCVRPVPIVRDVVAVCGAGVVGCRNTFGKRTQVSGATAGRLVRATGCVAKAAVVVAVMVAMVIVTGMGAPSGDTS